MADEPPKPVGHEPAQLTEKTYGVIVDCGSSGTRANLFEWDSSVEFPELLHKIEPMKDADGQVVTMKITPGLSSLRDEPDKASEYMQPIIDFILSKIPKHARRSTGIYILATAGLRLLDESLQLAMMRDIAFNLKINYDFAKVKTKVIPGSTEGMYQWMTVNSKAKRFLTINARSDSRTFGVIEMGGASIQVTYQLQKGMDEYIKNMMVPYPEAEVAFRDQIIRPQMSDEAPEYDYHLVSTTFLGFGSNSAREIYADFLVHQALKQRRVSFERYDPEYVANYTKDKPLILKDPCMPRGTEQLMEKPQNMLTARGKTVGFAVDETEPSFYIKLIGSGRHSYCHKYLSKVLARARNEKMNCERGAACTMSLLGTPFVPFYSYKFVGLADFYYTTNEMIKLPGRYNRKKIMKRLREICDMPYKQLLKRFPLANKYDKTRVQFECFKGVWMDVFLSQGLKMPDKYDKFETLNKIHGSTLDWTLGAVLDNSLTIEMAAEA